MQTRQLVSLINELKGNPSENEWIEFKHNFHFKFKKSVSEKVCIGNFLLVLPVKLRIVTVNYCI
jgi:hypothetical protein